MMVKHWKFQVFINNNDGEMLIFHSPQKNVDDYLFSSRVCSKTNPGTKRQSQNEKNLPSWKLTVYPPKGKAGKSSTQK